MIRASAAFSDVNVTSHQPSERSVAISTAALGAQPPAGWADYLGHAEVADYLRSVTR